MHGVVCLCHSPATQAAPLDRAPSWVLALDLHSFTMVTQRYRLALEQLL